MTVTSQEIAEATGLKRKWVVQYLSFSAEDYTNSNRALVFNVVKLKVMITVLINTSKATARNWKSVKGHKDKLRKVRAYLIKLEKEEGNKNGSNS